MKVLNRAYHMLIRIIKKQYNVKKIIVRKIFGKPLGRQTLKMKISFHVLSLLMDTLRNFSHDWQILNLVRHRIQTNSYYLNVLINEI